MDFENWFKVCRSCERISNDVLFDSLEINTRAPIKLNVLNERLSTLELGLRQR